MMTAEVDVSSPSGQQMTVRALLDPASTASFVTKRLAQHLKLKRSKNEIAINGIGRSQYPTLSNSIVNIDLKSTQSSSTLSNVEAIVLPSLIQCLPITSLFGWVLLGNTVFGWVLLGNTNGHHSTRESVTTLHASTMYPSSEETLQKFWALEELPKTKVPVSPADKLQKTLQPTPQGRRKWLLCC